MYLPLDSVILKAPSPGAGSSSDSVDGISGLQNQLQQYLKIGPYVAHQAFRNFVPLR